MTMTNTAKPSPSRSSPATPNAAAPNLPYTPKIEAVVRDGATDAARLQAKADQVARGGARAAVLGVNDGLVSNLCLILGVAGASSAASAVRIAGLASLVAGAFSMAAGEWISVRSQVELLQGVLAELRRLTERNPKLVLDTLANHLTEVGMEPSTASKATTELPLDEKSFFNFTARTVFGLNPDELGSPRTAALSSLGLFAVGAVVPLAPWFVTSGGLATVLSVIFTGLASLIVGAWVGRSSGGSQLRTALRQLLIVIIVAAVTYAIGKVVGTAVN